MPSGLSVSLKKLSMDNNIESSTLPSVMTSAEREHANDNPLLKDAASALEKESPATTNTENKTPESFLPSAEFPNKRPENDAGFYIEGNQDDENDDNGAEHKVLPKPQQQDDASDDTALLSKSPSNLASFPARSILKADVDEEIPVRTNKNRWKQLPAPDMEYVKMKRVESLNSIASRNSTPDLLGLVEGSNQDESKPQLPNKSPISVKSSSCPVLAKSDSKVSFQHIVVREYQQTIGDNPSVSFGAPISLDWDYQEDEPLHVDQYESTRGRRRNMEEMHLTHHRRQTIFAQEYGFSEKEIKAAKKATDKVKSQREFSKFVHMSMPGLLAIEEVRESAVRKFRRYRRRNSAECDSTNEAGVATVKEEIDSDGGDIPEPTSLRRASSAPV